jgi:hypothetical protein
MDLGAVIGLVIFGALVVATLVLLIVVAITFDSVTGRPADEESKRRAARRAPTGRTPGASP